MRRNPVVLPGAASECGAPAKGEQRREFVASPKSRWGKSFLLVLLLGLALPTGAATTSPDAPHANSVSTPAPAASPAPSVSPASEFDALSSTNLMTPQPKTKKLTAQDYQAQISAARLLRRNLDRAGAGRLLLKLLDSELPDEFRRAALFEMALVAQEDKQYARAQQILAQYLKLYPQDPTVPEVLLRQGLIFRQMGAHNTAIAKFYAVMNSALGLKLEQFDYYQKLVLLAQTEIADTYYVQGKFTEAADFFSRLLKQNAPELNRARIHFKLIRCLSGLGRHIEVVAQSETFFDQHSDAAESPELRFLCASSLKQLGRLNEARRHVLKLLESQQGTEQSDPANWLYWQQRAGNDIANQLYLEGDYLNALELYNHLAALSADAAWQLPVWYQMGLIYERLLQPAKAIEKFDAILAREKEVTAAGASPSLKTVLDMARWRKEQIIWRGRAEVAVQALRLSPILSSATNATPIATP
jgi:tetratricopeptide (TPR) repeat protein